MEQARVIGVVAGTVDEPRIAYLKHEAVIDASAVPCVGAMNVTEVFRFAAHCEDQLCAHFFSSRCTLGRRLVDGVDPVVTELPACTIRRTCRWFVEQGKPVCLRCPQVISLIPKGRDKLSQAAAPPLNLSRSEVRGVIGQ